MEADTMEHANIVTYSRGGRWYWRFEHLEDFEYGSYPFGPFFHPNAGAGEVAAYNQWKAGKLRPHPITEEWYRKVRVYELRAIARKHEAERLAANN